MIVSGIELNDRMTAPLKTIAKTMGQLISSMEKAGNTNLTPKDLATLSDGVLKAQHQISRLKDYYTQATPAIRNNAQKQKEWNKEISNAKTGMNGLMDKIKGIGLTLAAGFTVKKLINLSDEAVSIDARLNLITDTAEQKGNLKNYIYQMAQESKAPLNAFTSDVAKLGLLAGHVFSNNGEIVQFMGTMQKAFRISGTQGEEASAAMYQLNQALASGKLQGDEFRSVMENAPMLAQAIAKNMGVSLGELKKLGSEGKITSDIIRESVLGMTDEVNKKFKELPMTWSDIFLNAKNFGIRALEPLLKGINSLANNKSFQNLVNSMLSGFYLISQVGTKVFLGLGKVAGFIAKNWGFIEPLFFGIASAVGVFGVAMAIAKAKTVMATIAEMAHTAVIGAKIMATWMQIVVTKGMTVAQKELNIATWGFPGTWLVAAIVGIVVIIGAVILAMVKWATGTRTWTGIIVGSLYWVGAVFKNIISGIVYFVGSKVALIWNAFASVANFIGNVMRDPASSFINFVKDMALQSLDILKGFAGAVDKVIGTNFAGTVEQWKGNVQGVATTLSSKYGNGKYKGIVSKKTVADFGMDLGRKGLGASYDKGAKIGEGLANKFKNPFGDMGKIPDFNSMGGANNLAKDTGVGGKGGKDVGKNTGKTADNTGKMANSLEDSEEDLKYLRELAEQEHINQFTTAEIKVEMNNNNKIEKGMDLKEIIDGLANEIETRMTQIAEGVK